MSKLTVEIINITIAHSEVGILDIFICLLVEEYQANCISLEYYVQPTWGGFIFIA